MHLYIPRTECLLSSVDCILWEITELMHYYQQSIKYTPLCIPRAPPPPSLGIKIRSLLV